MITRISELQLRTLRMLARTRGLNVCPATLGLKSWH